MSRHASRGPEDPEALIADRYLDALLSGGTPPLAGGPDPALREAATVLRTALVRVHPSFRFEERLAARLAALAVPADRRGSLLAFPGTPSAGRPAAAHPADPLLPAVLRGELDPADAEEVARLTAASTGTDPGGAGGARRPLLVGGAITSAALSVLGIAWVARRALRAGGVPQAAGALAGTPAAAEGRP